MRILGFLFSLYLLMTNHCFLTEDRAIQQSTFGNGIVVTVNFGETAFSLPNGEKLAPMSFLVKQNSE